MGIKWLIFVGVVIFSVNTTSAFPTRIARYSQCPSRFPQQSVYFSNMAAPYPAVIESIDIVVNVEGPCHCKSEGSCCCKSEGSCRCKSEGSCRCKSEGSCRCKSEGSCRCKSEGSCRCKSEGSCCCKSEGNCRCKSCKEEKHCSKARCNDQLILPPQAVELPYGLGYFPQATSLVAKDFCPALDYLTTGAYIPVASPCDCMILAAPISPELAPLVKPIIL